jgi:hypothetical protein
MSKREIKALQAHWSRALAVALEAVEAGREAQTLPEAFCDAEVRHIKAERRWLETVQWP